ncbi:MAG TPA: CRTAC1 family protein [Pirellulaceae bacterium]|nr:CRTAC1 family protein [Pirellulaceae bacterium]
MKTQLLSAVLFVAGVSATMAQSPLVFRDAGDEAGLFPDVAKIAGHGVGWGDVDGDGWADLYVGAFGGHPYDSKPNQFFRNDMGKFRLDDQPQLRVLGRANGAIFIDLDNDGDLDLYTTNHAIDGGAAQPHYAEPNHLFRNDGGGKFTDVSNESATCPAGIAARSVTATDYDGDGLLDLFVGECFFQGGQSRTRLYRNLGGLKFENVSQAVGLPVELTGFGTVAGDVNGDGWPDLFVGGRHHGNKLFINDGKGKFTELPISHGDFTWSYKDTPDDTACGVHIADANRDGRADILVGSHCDRPWFTGGVPVRLWINRGNDGNLPKFEDVTEKAGLVPLPMKSPHVEIQDFDNDGWPDIYTSIVKFAANGQPHPVIFRGLGVNGGVPSFKTDALAVNDFPTDEEKKMGNVGPFFEKMQKEHRIVYMAPGPSGDYNRDGKLDLFLANWWVDDRSLLLKNETAGGHWLDVAVTAPAADGGQSPPYNRQGIGAVVRIYAPGKLGQAAALLGAREIAVGYGYASGQEAIAHFGLGAGEACDIEIILPHGKGKLERKDVKANQRISIPGDNS